MDCPACGKPVAHRTEADGSLNVVCQHCGWGEGDFGEIPVASSRPAIWKVGLLWVGAVAVIIGPYFALRFGVPYMLDVGVEGLDDAASRFISGLNIHYWWVMAAYIFLANVFNPTYDRSKLGWFGGYLDNPFSWEDDIERQKRGLAFILLPGKTVGAAVIFTWRLVFPR